MIKSREYNVYLNNKWIDTVFHTSLYNNIKERQEDVKQGLVDHDCYDPNIKVVETK